MEKLVKLIEVEEGWNPKPYYCSEDYPTVGFGFKIGNKGDDLPCFVLPKAAGDAWLLEILKGLEGQLVERPWYDCMNSARKAIIMSMMYQMGYNGVMKFKNMIKALEDKDYIKASNEMLDSKWAKQTPSRAHRHAIQLQGGSWHHYYN